MKCNETTDEPPTISEERSLQLSCYISSGKLNKENQIS
jgi:hypothetical protein